METDPHVDLAVIAAALIDPDDGDLVDRAFEALQRLERWHRQHGVDGPPPD